MNLRIATLDDLAQIKALVHAAYLPWVEVIGMTPGPMRTDYARSIAQGLLQVLEGPKGIEAILVLIPMPGAMLLDNIAVAPWAQGKGHASRLLRTAEMAAQAEGYRTIRLYAHEKMTSNIDLYHRKGFDITRRVTENGLDRVYMEKRVEYLNP